MKIEELLHHYGYDCSEDIKESIGFALGDMHRKLMLARDGFCAIRDCSDGEFDEILDSMKEILP